MRSLSCSAKSTPTPRRGAGSGSMMSWSCSHACASPIGSRGGFRGPSHCPVGWGWEDRQGRLAGAVLVRPLRPGGTVQLIDHLAVRPAAQQQGIGHCLLAAALSALQRQGALVATLEVEPDNAVARRLYAAAGFRLVDEAVDLVHPAARAASHAAAAPRWATEFTVRAYRRADFAPLQRLVNAAIPWIPGTPATSPAAGRLQAARTTTGRWLVDLLRAQGRRSYVVTGAAGNLLAFAEIARPSQTPASLLGFAPPYHRLRLIGTPDLPATTAIHPTHHDVGQLRAKARTASAHLDDSLGTATDLGAGAAASRVYPPREASSVSARSRHAETGYGDTGLSPAGLEPIPNPSALPASAPGRRSESTHSGAVPGSSPRAARSGSSACGSAYANYWGAPRPRAAPARAGPVVGRGVQTPLRSMHDVAAARVSG